MTAVLYNYPPLDNATIPDLNSGRFDKVLIDAGPIWLSGTQEQYERFCGELAYEIAHLPDGSAKVLFCSATGRGPKKRWKLRSNSQHGDGRFLASGSLTSTLVQHVRPELPGGNARFWSLNLQIAVNPTRFVRYQPSINENTSEVSPIPRLLASHQSEHTDPNHEIVLMDADNYLIDCPHSSSLNSNELLPIMIRTYLEHTYAVILQTITSSAEAYDMIVQANSTSMRLKEIECYWEFADPEPIQTVERISTQIRLPVCLQATRYYELSRCEFLEVDYSPRIKYDLGSGRALKIYPKTTRRIRLEYTFCESALRQTLRNQEHQIVDIESLVTALLLMRNCAFELLEQDIARFQNITDLSNREVNVSSFIQKIYRSSTTPREAKLLLDTLVNRGGISLRQNARLNTAVRRLRQNRVLELIETRGKSRIYSVTEEYRPCTERLRTAFQTDESTPQCG